MTRPALPAAPALCPDETAQTCAATDSGAACVGVADLLADLLSTRVCPTVYRLAWLQGRERPPLPIYLRRCETARPRDENAPGALRRREETGLGRALVEALTSWRLRRAGADV